MGSPDPVSAASPPPALLAPQQAAPWGWGDCPLQNLDPRSPGKKRRSWMTGTGSGRPRWGPVTPSALKTPRLWDGAQPLTGGASPPSLGSRDLRRPFRDSRLCCLRTFVRLLPAPQWPHRDQVCTSSPHARPLTLEAKEEVPEVSRACGPGARAELCHLEVAVRGHSPRPGGPRSASRCRGCRLGGVQHGVTRTQ